MGPFADTLFSVLLGWLCSAARGAWQLITGAEASAWLQWTLQNWLPLLILLCIAGLAVDWVVHFFRWQPWRIWRQLWQKEEEVPEEDSGRYRQWVYADGSTRMEEVDAQEPAGDEQLHQPVRRVRRAPQVIDPGTTFHQPYYPPQWQQTPQGEPHDE